MMKRIFKLTVWHKGTSKIAWTERIETVKTEKDFEKQIEGEFVNTNLFDYRYEEC